MLTTSAFDEFGKDSSLVTTGLQERDGPPTSCVLPCPSLLALLRGNRGMKIWERIDTTGRVIAPYPDVVQSHCSKALTLG